MNNTCATPVTVMATPSAVSTSSHLGCSVIISSVILEGKTEGKHDMQAQINRKNHFHSIAEVEQWKKQAVAHSKYAIRLHTGVTFLIKKHGESRKFTVTPIEE